MILGGAGTIVGVAALGALLAFANASDEPDDGRAPRPGGNHFPTIQELEETGGIVAAFGFVGTLTGVASLVVFAQNVGGEYAWGTLKVALTRQPGRLSLLGGKLLALAAFVGLAIGVAALVHVGVAASVAAARGIDTSAWWTFNGFGELGAAALRTWGSATAWGLLGALLSVLFRSPAPAIGVGIGYTVVGETLLALALQDEQKWLPGRTLAAFAAGGTDDMAMGLAALLLALWATAFLATAGWTFQRRDVNG